MDDSGVSEQKTGPEQSSRGNRPASRKELEGLKHGKAMKGLVEAMGKFKETGEVGLVEEARRKRDELLGELDITGGTLLSWCKEVAEKEEGEFETELGKVDSLVVGALFDENEGPKEAAKHLARMKVFEMKMELSREPEEEKWEGRIEGEIAKWEEYARSCETTKERAEREKAKRMEVAHKREVVEVGAGERRLAGASGAEGGEEGGGEGERKIGKESEEEVRIKGELERARGRYRSLEDEWDKTGKKPEGYFEARKKVDELRGQLEKLRTRRRDEDVEEVFRDEEEVDDETTRKYRGLEKAVERSGEVAEKAAEQFGSLEDAVMGLTGTLRDLERRIEEGTIKTIEELEAEFERLGGNMEELMEKSRLLAGKVEDLDKAMVAGRATVEEYTKAMNESAEVMKKFTGWVDEEEEYHEGLWERMAKAQKEAAMRTQRQWEVDNEGMGERFAANGYWRQEVYDALGEQEDGKELQEQYRRGFVFEVDKALAELKRPDRPFSQAAWQETNRVLRMIYSIKDEHLRTRLLLRYDDNRKIKDYSWVFDRAASVKECTSAVAILTPDAMGRLMRDDHYLEKKEVGADDKERVKKRVVKDAGGNVIAELVEYEEMEYRVVDSIVDEYQAMVDVWAQLEHMKRKDDDEGRKWRAAWMRREREKYENSDEFDPNNRGKLVEVLKRKYGKGVGDLEDAYKAAVKKVQSELHGAMILKKQGFEVDPFLNKEEGWGGWLVKTGDNGEKLLDEMVFDDEVLLNKLKGWKDAGGVEHEGMVKKYTAEDEKNGLGKKGEAKWDEVYGDVHQTAAIETEFDGIFTGSGVLVHQGGFHTRRLEHFDDLVRGYASKRFPHRWLLIQGLRLTPDACGWLSARGLGMDESEFEGFKEEYGIKAIQKKIGVEGSGDWLSLDTVRIEDKDKFMQLNYAENGVSERRHAIYSADGWENMDVMRLLWGGGGTQSVMAKPELKKLIRLFDEDVKWFSSDQEQSQRVVLISKIMENYLYWREDRALMPGSPFFEKVEIKDTEGNVVGSKLAFMKSESELALGKTPEGVAMRAKQLGQVIDTVESYIGPGHAEYLRREFMKFGPLPGVVGVRQLREFWEEAELHKTVPGVLFLLLLSFAEAAKEGVGVGLAETGLGSPKR
jgi:hypothetical protein